MMYLFVVGLIIITGTLADIEYETEFISIKSFQRRNEIDETSELQLEAFTKKYHLLLKRSEIFAPDFEAVSVSGSSTGKQVIEKRSLQLDDIGEFYTVKDGFGSLHISKRDNIEVNGILDEGILIRPLRSEDIEDNFNHMVLRPKVKQNSGERDYVNPDKMERRDTNETSQSVEPFPQSVVLEICPFLDYNNTKALKKDMRKVAQYLGIFYNNVNARYRQLENPELRIVLSGFIMANESADEPFPESKKFPSDRLDQTVLDDIREWLVSNKAQLPKHDSIVLHLSYDVGTFKDGEWLGKLAGLAFRGATCDESGYNLAYAEDTAPDYTGILIVPHEMAHGLDSPHDGEEQAADCPASDRYIMGSGQFGENCFKFSSCSLESMKNFIRSDKAECLRSSFQETYPMINLLPGLIESPDQQCAARHGETYLSKQLFDPELCNTLWCGLEGSSFYSSGAALDGTTCGINKICMNGDCIDNPVPSPDKQCQSNFGTLYFAANKNSADFCQKLFCTVTKIFVKTKGAPMTGTLCGNGGTGTDVCQTLGCVGSNGKILSYGGAMEGTSCGLNSVIPEGQRIYKNLQDRD